MARSAEHPPRRRMSAWIWTVLAVIIAAEFVLNAVQKLIGIPSALAPFVEFGWPLWMASATAVAEIIGAVALIIPVTRTLGGLLLALIMIGAAFTNIANGHSDYIWLNVLLLVVAMLLAWEGRRHLRRYRLPRPRA